jgi:hypothetical protein
MSELFMTDVEFAVRPDTRSPDTVSFEPLRTEPHRPSSYGRVQALAQTLQPLTPQPLGPFATFSDTQPSDHGYDDYWLDPIEP